MVTRQKKRAPKPHDKNDRETHSPPAKWLTATRTPDPGSSAPVLTNKQRETRNAVAELARISAARPLRPPPFPNHHDTRSAGAIALAAEIREGSYEP